MTTTQADPATMKARELRLLANRMRRANEPDLARQLDKRAAEVLLDISGPEQGRKTSRTEAARAWLLLFGEATQSPGRLWSPTTQEPADGWIGAWTLGPTVGLLPAWVSKRLRESGYSTWVVQEWKRQGWIQPDATGKSAMLTTGPEGRQRMIRMRCNAEQQVRSVVGAEPDR